MTVLFKNNARSKLAGPLTTTGTTINLTPGDGAKFPAPTGDDWFPVTIVSASEIEICKCTARSGDSLTVVRAQEGTGTTPDATGYSFLAGDRVDLRLTAAAIEEIQLTEPEFASKVDAIMTAAEILERVKTVDGTDSGLDADRVRGAVAGTVLTKNITTTQTSTTAGAVLKVGDYGLGITASLGVADANAQIALGDYHVAPGTTGLPFDGHGRLSVKGYLTQPTQTFQLSANGRIWTRSLKVNNDFTSWTDWAEIYTNSQVSFTGMVAAFPSVSAPTGWLKLNGSTHSRNTYADLWAFAQASGNLAVDEGSKLPGQFGPGDGVNTFTLPDVRAEFLRGWDDGKGVDTDREIGSWQDEDIIAHSHNAKMSRSDAGATSGVTPGPEWFAKGGNNPTEDLHVTQSTGGAETRPRNIALLYCIKY